MKVPLAWLRDYVELPADSQAVADMLAQIGFPVDAIEERPLVTGVVAGRIEQLDKHPNADRLQVGKIDVGNGRLLTIATAATNVERGQTIAVATVGARLPQLTIERRKMRGVESDGMMISADELALPPEWFEDGIMQFDAALEPGTNVVERFRLSEPVLDVDVTSNRADAMSMIGLARELAAYQDVPLRLPQLDYACDRTASAPPAVQIDAPDCRRFVVQRFTGVHAGASPAWMRVRLALAGQRPINRVVDISNYVMLETGQPLHFYDDAKIPGSRLIVRDALQDETIVTLDGQEHRLNGNDLVIASENGAEGIAGLKGGRRSEVNETTRAILLESASFTGARVRRTSARLGFRTDAGARHEKALPLAFTDLGQQRAAHLLTAQGATAQPALAFGAPVRPPDPIDFDLRDVKRLLGYDLDAQAVRGYLDRLGFEVQQKDSQRVLVTPPLWRPDVTIAADVVEEIARMAGYDRIESAIPALAQHDIRSASFELESRTAQTLCALGYHEIASIALHGRQIFERLDRAGLQPSFPPVEVLNPLSEDQRYLRFALGPAFMQYFARHGGPVRIFELGHIFYREDGQPLETPMAAFAFTAPPLDEPPWRDSHLLAIKGDTEALLRELTGRREFEYAADARNGAHPGKTTAVLLDGREVAFICRVDPRLEKAFGISLPVYGCWIFLQRIPDYVSPLYRAPSKYPSTYRDVAIVCDLDVTSASVQKTIAGCLGELCTGVAVFDEYRGPQIAPDKKSLAVRVTLQRTDATITDKEAESAIERALRELGQRLGAVLRT